MPYLGALWHPVPVTAVYGRYARADPPCPPRTAVHYAWKDVLLPLMQDPTFPQDVLFFVVEEDWRLREQDAWHERQLMLGSASSASGPPASMQEPAALQAQVPGPTPRSLADLVAAVTQATRAGHGDLVWLSYMLQDGRYEKTAPSYGSTMLALTQRTARVVAAWMANDGSRAVQHFDVWLKMRLSRDAQRAAARQLHAAYPTPGLGCFVEHASGCQPNIGQRQAEWLQHWVQEGTRVEDSTVKPGRSREMRCLGPWWKTKVIVPNVHHAMSATSWWRTLAQSDAVLEQLVPAIFKRGLPEANASIARRPERQSWKGMCFLVTPGLARASAGEPSAKQTAVRSRKRKRHELQPMPFDDPLDYLHEPGQHITQRQLRNRRKVGGAFFKHRIWVCHQEPAHSSCTGEPSAPELFATCCVQCVVRPTLPFQEYADAHEFQAIATRTLTGPDAARAFRVQQPRALMEALWQIDVPEPTSDEDNWGTWTSAPEAAPAASSGSGPGQEAAPAAVASQTASNVLPPASDVATEASLPPLDVWALLNDLSDRAA